MDVKTENEKKKELLMSYQKSLRRERQILDEIQELRASKMFPSVINDGMPHGSNQTDLSNYIVSLSEKQEELKHVQLEVEKAKQKVYLTIKQVNDDEREILQYRYIDGLKWDDVQRKMGFNNLRGIYKIHSNALKNIRLAKQYKM